MTFDAMTHTFDTLFGYPDSYGVVRRALTLGEKQAMLYYIDGLIDTDAVSRVLSFCLAQPPDAFTDAASFCAALIPYGDATTASDTAALYKGAATGCLLLLSEAFSGCGILVKCRETPCRSLEEPEYDKVLRGAHIGFGETLPRNIALLRRMLPDPSLLCIPYSVGTATKTTVLLCYQKDRADETYLSFVKQKLASIQTETVNLGMQSIAECLIRKRVWNPFPRFRYTERPDAAAASLCEGSILLFCDNSPQAMILPVSIFSFFQETNDFYMTPFTGTYLRLLRIVTFLLSLYLTPVWYALIRNPASLPEWMSFVAIKEEITVPVFLQLLLLELAVDGLKMASLNTPNALSNSLSVIGGLILGDYAIQVGWILPETVLYMAVIAVAQFTQHNFELGYAFKYVRISMLILTALIGWWGILCGTALLVFLLVTTPTLEEKRRYFYPLIPFHGKALFRLFFRVRKPE